jgi:hypothetical protein
MAQSVVVVAWGVRFPASARTSVSLSSLSRTGPRRWSGGKNRSCSPVTTTRRVDCQRWMRSAGIGPGRRWCAPAARPGHGQVMGAVRRAMSRTGGAGHLRDAAPRSAPVAREGLPPQSDGGPLTAQRSQLMWRHLKLVPGRMTTVGSAWPATTTWVEPSAVSSTSRVCSTSQPSRRRRHQSVSV